MSWAVQLGSAEQEKNCYFHKQSDCPDFRRHLQSRLEFQLHAVLLPSLAQDACLVLDIAVDIVPCRTCRGEAAFHFVCEDFSHFEQPGSEVLKVLYD
jgi:hypothetical protein